MGAPTPVDVTWAGDPGCGSAPELEQRIAELGVRTDASGPLDAVAATVTRTPTGWSVSLTLRGTEGDRVRTFAAPDCRGLIDGAAFIVAVALDETASAPQPPAPTPEPSPPPAPPTPARLWGSVAVLGGIRVGAWPLGGSVGLGMALEGRAFRVELRGAYDPPVDIAAQEDPSTAMRVQLGRVALRGCAVQRWDRVDLPFCALVEGSIIDARGIDLETNARQRRFGFAPGLAGGVGGRVGERVSLGVDLAGLVPVLRHQFVAGPDPVLEVFTMGPAELRALAEIRVRFP